MSSFLGMLTLRFGGRWGGSVDVRPGGIGLEMVVELGGRGKLTKGKVVESVFPSLAHSSNVCWYQVQSSVFRAVEELRAGFGFMKGILKLSPQEYLHFPSPLPWDVSGGDADIRIGDGKRGFMLS